MKDFLLGILIWGAIIGGRQLLFSGNNDTQEITQSSFTESNYEDSDDEYIDDTEYERTDDYTVERSYDTYGDYDCSDFGSQDEAQEFFESEGGPDEDYHNLDRDGDGEVCETLL
jgi:hypothetical protein